ncbi:MAG: hypothetical protein WC782_04740 [Methylococcaceae bacterium]|jgi:hypothetical protein
MKLIKNLIANILKLVYRVKDEHLTWQQNNQPKLATLRLAKVLAENDLAAELKKRGTQLEHDIAMLKTQHTAELAMFKIKCQQDVQDYKQYLQSLEQLKRSIEMAYQHLPESVAFAIHHHAKYLLNKMWEAQAFEERMAHEMRLIQFMSTVHEDARLCLEGSSHPDLPEKTLSLIQKAE